jgi:hypothetical protein
MKFRQNWFKQEVKILRSEIHKLMNSIWIKEEFPERWKESTILPI